MAYCRCPGPRSVLSPHAPPCPMTNAPTHDPSVRAREIVERLPWSPWDEDDCGRAVQVIAAALTAEAERSQPHVEVGATGVRHLVFRHETSVGAGECLATGGQCAEMAPGTAEAERRARLVEALENMICWSCENRIGWDGPKRLHCGSCKAARAALAEGGTG